jgi:hypothetical protein
MSLTPSLTKVCGLIKTAGQAGDIGAAGAGAVAIAGVTLTLPWSAVCAAGIIALAGAAVLVERRDAEKAEARATEHDQRAEEVRQWVEAFARDKACQAGGLAAAIEAHLKDNPDALDGLSANITRNHLTTFLSIIKAEGDEQTKLLKEHDGFVRAVSAEVIERLDAVNKSLRAIEGLVELTHGEVRSMAAATVVTGKTAAETRSLVTELLFKHDRSRSPALHIPLDTTGLASQRFIFRSRTLACVGRRDEFIELDRWLHKDTRPFSWDLWTAMAGMGKSRLALELCLKLPASWDAGFMDSGAGRTIDWITWTPGRDTLIVCDYVAREVDQIKTMLDRLASYTGSNRVRVLLLERPIARFERPSADDDPAGGLSLAMTQAAAEGWWTKLGVGTDGPFKTMHARRMANGKPDRMLEGVSEAALFEMIRAEARTRTTAGEPVLDDAEVERRAALIEQVTPNRRPLFIAMAAEAIREKTADGATEDAMIDAKTLVEHIRDKEDRKHWTSALEAVPPERGTAVGYRRLLCFATLCGGLDGDALRESLNDDRFKDVDGNRLLPNATQYGDGAIYARLIPDADSSNAPKLEPDLLGECFVLSVLGSQPDLAQQMITVGWQHARDGIADFLRRAAGNFPEHPGLMSLAFALPDGETDDEADRCVFSIIFQACENYTHMSESSSVENPASDLLNRAGLGPLSRAGASFFALSARSTNHPIESLLEQVESFLSTADRREQWSLYAIGLTNCLAQQDESPERRRRLLGLLHRCISSQPQADMIDQAWEHGVFNAAAGCSSTEDRIQLFFDEREWLEHAFPEGTAAREALTDALHEAIRETACEPHGLPMINGLRAAFRDNPDEPSVRWLLARFLLGRLVSRGPGSGRVRRMVDELRALNEKPGDDPCVRVAFAEALAFAATATGANARTADDRREELGVLAEENKNDAWIAGAWAGVLFEQSLKLGIDRDQMDETLDELRTLERRHGTARDVYETYADALWLAILLSHFPKSFNALPESERADQLSEELEDLFTRTPEAGVHLSETAIDRLGELPDDNAFGKLYFRLLEALINAGHELQEQSPESDHRALAQAAGSLAAAFDKKWPGWLDDLMSSSLDG